MSIDFTTDHGQHALHALKQEHVVWLTTVGNQSGTPQPNVVWFLYQDGDVVVYNKPDSLRLKNIANNDRISLNFDSINEGEKMIIFSGTAAIDPDTPAVIDNPAYLEKYSDGIRSIGSAPQKMSDEYNVAIRISLDSLRGW